MQFSVYLTACILVVTTTSVQLCHLRPSTQVSVADVTKQYLAQISSILAHPKPPSILSQAIAIETIGSNLLFMTGLDGDIPFVIQVLNRIEDLKWTTINDYVRHTSQRMVNLFFANYLPAIGRALGPLLVASEIRQIIAQLTSNFRQHHIALQQTMAEIGEAAKPFLKAVIKELTDLNQRAIAARESGHTDLSGFETELNALQTDYKQRGEEGINVQITTLNTNLIKYLENVKKISLDISRRCRRVPK